MTDEVKSGPGRPPKVRPQAKELEFVEPAPEAKVEEPRERLVEVQFIRKYVPIHGQDPKAEIKQSVPGGTVLSLPVKEAQRALKLGIARATDRTFD